MNYFRLQKLKTRVAGLKARFKYSAPWMFLLSLSIVLLLPSCVTKPPQEMDNLCSIFFEKRGWYKSAKKAEDRWGSPIPVLMAFVHQESRYTAKAKPPRRKILWVIPGPRLSTAYGYSQAKQSTWDWYRDKTGNRGADRDDFADAVDFIGWYNAQSAKTNGIALNDAYRLYLAYHEGHGGYSRRTYDDKAWLKNTANKVASLSNRYSTQLTGCQKKLEKSGWWPF